MLNLLLRVLDSDCREEGEGGSAAGELHPSADPWSHHRGVPDHLPLCGGLHGQHGLWTATFIQSGAWPEDQAEPVGDTPLSHSERG